ncbi:MAG TPA: hypothetical protein VFN95_02880, partial [Flavitalea sp.]|nr:hypothetical protein [Flavitalea sp.]
KKVELKPHAWIGLITENDTIGYSHPEDNSYYIFTTGKDSIILRKPDSVIRRSVNYQLIYENKLAYEYRMKKYFKGDGELFCEIEEIANYQYKSFAYKDILSLIYTLYTGKGDGCIGCWFVPGLNILWMIEVLKRQPNKVDLNKWTFVIE